MSWWRSLVAKLIEVVAGSVQEKIVEPPTPDPRRPVSKYGKRDR